MNAFFFSPKRETRKKPLINNRQIKISIHYKYHKQSRQKGEVINRQFPINTLQVLLLSY